VRVVSLVPSWTETLLESGVNVAGRTRFCVHPSERVGAIPTVGGTKDLDLAALAALKPDLLILDKEENLPWMAEAPWPLHVSHITSANCVARELDALSSALANPHLASLAAEWRAELASPAYPSQRVCALPGIIDWIREPTSEPENLLYLVWRAPWMAVSRDTFVGSMLTQVGFGGRIPPFPEKYPKLDLGKFDPTKTLLLFSTEPFPFAQKKAELLGLGFPAALVDGEAYSWFGSRSLRFLQDSRKNLRGS
jgi:iron complex transport system substrate-binding protein